MKISWEQAQEIVTKLIKDDLCDDEILVTLDSTLQELDFMRIDLVDLLNRLEKACHGHSILSAKERVLVRNHRHEIFLRTTVWDIVRRLIKVYESIPESAVAA